MNFSRDTLSQQYIPTDIQEDGTVGGKCVSLLFFSVKTWNTFSVVSGAGNAAWSNLFSYKNKKNDRTIKAVSVYPCRCFLTGHFRRPEHLLTQRVFSPPVPRLKDSLSDHRATDNHTSMSSMTEHRLNQIFLLHDSLWLPLLYHYTNLIIVLIYDPPVTLWGLAGSLRSSIFGCDRRNLKTHIKSFPRVAGQWGTVM